MRWEITEEQRAFQDAYSSWLGHVAPPETAKAWFESGNGSSFDQKLYGEGWVEVGLGEDVGGQGGGLLELALMAEEMGRAAVPSGSWLASVLSQPALVALGTHPARTLGADNRVVLVIPADRLPDSSLREVRAEGGFVTGSSPLVLAAEGARWLMVPAMGEAGLDLYIVDATSEEVVIRSRMPLDRNRRVADVSLDRAQGLKLGINAQQFLQDVALRAAVLVAADSLGASERMLDMAVEYSKERHQFGVPIGSFQAMKHAAATMLVEVESARSIVYYAATSVEQRQDDAPLHAGVAKAQVTVGGILVADSSLTMHGAIGYTWEHDLHRYYKRSKFDGVLYGSSKLWNERIAAVLLDNIGLAN